jgi:uncharacterized protein (TIGR02996 family)
MTRGDELRAQLLAAPDDVGAHLVYADWLQSQGDPHGDLIVAQQEYPAHPVAERILRLHGRLLLGNLDGVDCAWRCGFIRYARLFGEERPTATAAVLDELLQLPTVLLLEELCIERTDSDEHSLRPAIEALCRRPPPLLQRLTLGPCYPAPFPAITNINGLDKATPRLKQLRLCSRFGGYVLDALVAAQWRLDELTLRPEGAAEVEDLPRVLAAPSMSELRKLELRGMDAADIAALEWTSEFPHVAISGGS